jgi:hypothetical protein
MKKGILLLCLLLAACGGSVDAQPNELPACPTDGARALQGYCKD